MDFMMGEDETAEYTTTGNLNKKLSEDGSSLGGVDGSSINSSASRKRDNNPLVRLPG